jgi:hypothetical protein
MLIIFRLRVVMLNAVKPSVIMLYVIMLSVLVLNVVAPNIHLRPMTFSSPNVYLDFVP